MAVGSILLAQGILLLVEVLLVQLDHQSPEMPQRLPQPNQLWQESSYGQLEKQGIGKHEQPLLEMYVRRPTGIVCVTWGPTTKYIAGMWWG